MRLGTALFASVLLGCSRPTTESKATQTDTLPTATAPAANDAGTTFVVRIHR